MRRVDWSLYAITPEGMALEDLLAAVGAALEAGVTVLQVRRKGAEAGDLARWVRAVVALARPRGVPVIVNDRLDVALAAGADGVHLGRSDLSLTDARRIAPGLILGASTDGPDQAVEAAREGASYVAVGAVYASPSKETPNPGGPARVAAVRRVYAGPLVAIGGIRPEHVAEVVAAGADGVAVISGIFGGGAVPERVAAYRRALDRALHSKGSGWRGSACDVSKG